MPPSGVPLIRQGRGKGNAVFITIEDESGIANAPLLLRSDESGSATRAMSGSCRSHAISTDGVASAGCRAGGSVIDSLVPSPLPRKESSPHEDPCCRCL